MHQLNRLVLLIIGFGLFFFSCSSKKDKAETPKTSTSDLSSDANHKFWLFVGTYTRKEGHVDGKAAGLYWYELDTAQKAISLIDTYTNIINPSYLTVSPNHQYIYAISEIDGDSTAKHGQIHALHINTTTKKLDFINKRSTEGDYPCYVSTDNEGGSAMVANYGTGNIAFFPLNEDGSLDSATSVMQHEGKGADKSRQSGPHAHMIVPAPNNAFLLSNDLGTDKIYSYPVDYQLQVLSKQQVAATTHPGAGPRHLVFHPQKSIAYVVNELNGTIEAFNYQEDMGTLERFQTISTVAEGQDGKLAGCADIHISPDGKYVYASNRGEFNNIAIFEVNQEDGSLTLTGHQSTKGKTPRNFVLGPNTSFLLAANQDTDNIVYFDINAKNGQLIDPNIQMEVPSPVCLKIIAAQ